MSSTSDIIQAAVVESEFQVHWFTRVTARYMPYYGEMPPAWMSVVIDRRECICYLINQLRLLTIRGNASRVI